MKRKYDQKGRIGLSKEPKTAPDAITRTGIPLLVENVKDTYLIKQNIFIQEID